MMRGKIRITRTLVIMVLVSTLLIEFVLLFMHGCSDGEGLIQSTGAGFLCRGGLCLWRGAYISRMRIQMKSSRLFITIHLMLSGLIATTPLSLISIICLPIAVLFCMTIHCHFVVCHCDPIQLMTSIVRLVVAGNRC